MGFFKYILEICIGISAFGKQLILMKIKCKSLFALRQFITYH